MPMLPSGRKVALDPAPLVKMLDDPDSPFHVHHILEIKEWEDLARYLDIVFLEPAPPGAPDDAAARLAPGSHPAPVGMVAVPSGHRLDALEQAWRGWPEKDCAAMREYIEERAKPHFSALLEEVRKRQEYLMESAPPMTRALAHMHRRGIHPLQTEGTEEDP
jgi:hypothetical protein